MGEIRIRHDCRRVAVDKHDLVAFFFECLTRLRAGVVKLARLPDDNGTGTDN